MATVDERVLREVHSLSDLALAALLCLITREHCLISTEPDALDDLVHELQAIASRTFGLRSAVVDCTSQTTLDDFATALLLPQPRTLTADHTRSTTSSPHNARHDSYFPPRPSSPAGISIPGGSTFSPSPAQPPALSIANVVLARNLDRAPKAVQIQALELLRTRRIFTRTAVQVAPKQFLFVAVLGAASGGEARVTPHLNDFLFLSHWHDAEEEGFEYLEDEEREELDLEQEGEQKGGGSEHGGDGEGTVIGSGEDGASIASTESIVKKRSGSRRSSDPVLAESEIAHLAQLCQQVQVDVDVLRYEMNIVSFLRMHRAVAGGVTPAATKHFQQLAKCLAPLHGLDYVTPALVGMAARKVYLHRIVIVAPERERSMQWGSELRAVEALLQDVGPEEVIEDVLDLVSAPV